ncbi:MAG: DUF5320 domain-containing protein [Spirochaetota bacterium]
MISASMKASVRTAQGDVSIPFNPVIMYERKKCLTDKRRQHMPHGDRRGPEGLGPRTGRANGYCTGNPAPGFANRPYYGRGRGFGPGRGVGRGRFYRFGAPYPPYSGYYHEQWRTNPDYHADDMNQIRERISWYQDELARLKGRLDELSAEEDSGTDDVSQP